MCTKPLIGVPADRRVLEPHPFHMVGEKYVAAIRDGAGGVPFMIPSLGDSLDADDILSRLDGLLLTGSPSNVEPHHYDGEPSRPGTMHDPHRDETTLRLIDRAGRRPLLLAGSALIAISMFTNAAAFSAATYTLDQVGEAALAVHRNEAEGKLGVLCLAPAEGLGAGEGA